MANGRLILPALGLRNTKRMVQHRLTILRTGCPLSPQALNNTHVAPMRTTLSFEMAGIPILVGLVHTPAEGILQVARVRVPSEVDNVRYHPMLSGGEHVSRFATAGCPDAGHVVLVRQHISPVTAPAGLVNHLRPGHICSDTKPPAVLDVETGQILQRHGELLPRLTMIPEIGHQVSRGAQEAAGNRLHVCTHEIIEDGGGLRPGGRPPRRHSHAGQLPEQPLYCAVRAVGPWAGSKSPQSE